jgi:hypothetical protein
MAIGDKIDWRAGTIDPTTLQLIASAGAAQGAMYQSLGESVSKAFEKDSEDYIVDAGKAFDKADKLLEREDDEDFNEEKYEKLIKKGVNLFRKAGEKYNIATDSFGGGAVLRTEEDIYEFYGFDPSKKPRPVSTKRDKSRVRGQMEDELTDAGLKLDKSLKTEEKPYRPWTFEDPPFDPTWLANRLGLQQGFEGRTTGMDIGQTPTTGYGAYTPHYGTGTPSNLSRDQQILPSPRNTLGIDQGLPPTTGYGAYTPFYGTGPPSNISSWSTKTPHFGSGEVSGQEIANMAAQAVVAQTPKAESINTTGIPSTSISAIDSLSQGADMARIYATEEVVPNLEAMWDITKSGGTKVWDFLSGGAEKALDFVQHIGGFGNQTDLGPATFTPTGGTLNEGFNQPNPFNPTLDSLGLDEQIDPFSEDYYTEEDKETIKGYNQSNFR